ncbi:MAG TPA: type I restriction endonuclease [Longimicrobium sp.]
MSEEFRSALVTHAQTVVERAVRAQSEAATQQYLVLPFLQLLGYDPLDPDEVIPEAHASFSDKFKNRVDYSISVNGNPAIAIECKKVGTLSEANRGELKGYFNAVPTVKLGILTDGLQFQLYTDTGLENLMDDQPFAVVDLSEVARGQVDPTAFDALSKLRKGTFDPAFVGADARRRIYTAQYADALDKALSRPDERFVRTMMDLANVEGRRTNRMVEEHAPIIRDAAEALLDRKILERVGFADRKDLVKMRTEAIPSAPDPEPVATPAADGEMGVVTTEVELFVLDYVKTRLPFLVGGDEVLFSKLQHVRPIDHKTVFTLFYRQERKGRLFNFRQGRDPQYRFDFMGAGGATLIDTDDLASIDQALLAAFKQRVQELG